MKKRILSILIALTVMLPVPASAAESVPEAEASVSGKEDSADEDTSDTVIIDLSKYDLDTILEKLQKVKLTEKDLEKLRMALQALNMSQEDMDKYMDMLLNMDMEEIFGNISTVHHVIESEEFQHLMEYPEMQALAGTAGKKAIELIFEDPALTGKIMVTMGMDEKLAKILVVFAEVIKSSEGYSGGSVE